MIGDFQHMLSPSEELYLTRSCHLILKHNEFTGTQWCRDLSTRNPVLVSLFGFFEWPLDVTFLVDRPTEEEHYQALKAWSEWLDNKVNACEKQELLQLLDKVGGVSNVAKN